MTTGRSAADSVPVSSPVNGDSRAGPARGSPAVLLWKETSCHSGVGHPWGVGSNHQRQQAVLSPAGQHAVYLDSSV